MLLPLLLIIGCGPRTDGDPGRVTLQRLNRAEYDNTVRDLLGTELRPARDFPPDDFGNGFDNQGDVLSLSPLHIEMYERAADLLVNEALGTAAIPPERWQVEAESDEATATAGGEHGGWAWNLWSNGAISTSVSLPVDGRYTFEVLAFGTQAGDDLVAMALLVDGLDVRLVDVEATEDAVGTYAVEVELAAGSHVFGAAFLNDYYNPELDEDRNLIVDWLRVEGPLDRPAAAADPRVVVCDPAQVGERPCAETIVRDLGQRAWRRPLTDDDADGLLSLYDLSRDSGGDWNEGVGLVVKALLLSPHFLFRVEIDPNPTADRPHPLNDWELASRLSYFLWSSMPDDELFALAEAGELSDPQVVEAQVRRMLADPRADALIEGLAGQWLYLRAIDDASPDYNAFPAWDDELRASMRESLHRFLADVLLADRSMLELLTADETWLDARLAEHYGLEPPESGFARVELPERSAGLLTQGALLTSLSYPARTSPVKRGRWVLGNLLCEAPAPPPPGVEGLVEDAEGEALTIRERMEQHRSDPVCSSCHAAMDPIGFSMEHFDAVGAWRALDETGAPVDATGRLPSGESFDGVAELGALLAESEKLPRCMVQKSFTYALGRALTVEDIVYLEQIEAGFAAGGHRFEELAVAIAVSEPFRLRRGEPEVSR